MYCHNDILIAWLTAFAFPVMDLIYKTAGIPNLPMRSEEEKQMIIEKIIF